MFDPIGDLSVRRVRNGATVFSQGDPADGMYVVLSGRVRVFTTIDGHETTLSVLNEGDFFGEMSLLTHKPRSASAAAVGDVELRRVSEAEFEHRYLSDPVVRHMLIGMSERLQAADAVVSRLDAENVARHTYLSNMSVHREWVV